jgi:hypothetical protein
LSRSKIPRPPASISRSVCDPGLMLDFRVGRSVPLELGPRLFLSRAVKEFCNITMKSHRKAKPFRCLTIRALIKVDSMR